MGKLKSNHHVQKLFVLFGVLISCLALGIIVYSSQSSTNLKSDASGCNDKPKLILDTGSSNIDWKFVSYKLKLINNCPNPKRFYISVTTPTEPVNYKNWRWGLAQGFVAPSLNNDPILTKYIDKDPTVLVLSVARPEGVNMRKDSYRYFTVKAALEKNDNIYDTISLIYRVD